jgi:hypothetical protein
VTEENLQAAAENYLVKKVSLTEPELELLKTKLAGKAGVWDTRDPGEWAAKGRETGLSPRRGGGRAGRQPRKG